MKTIKGEIVLLLQEKINWRNIVKMLGKDFTEIKDENIVDKKIVLPSEQNSKFNEYRTYAERKKGVFKSGTSEISITYDKGSTVVKGQKVYVNEIVLSKISGHKIDCIKLAMRLTKKHKIVLEARTHEQRIKSIVNGTEYGRFHVKEFSSRTVGEAIEDLMWWHLCGISQAGAEFCLHKAERLPVRRLRVELRKLRAVLTMLEKVLLPDVAKWQEKLRSLTIKLAPVRELDVALSGWRSTALNKRKYSFAADKLAIFLHKARIAEVNKIKEDFEFVNFTPFLLEIMHWAMNDPIKQGKSDVLLEKIADKKLANWFTAMQKIVKAHPDFDDDELAHEIRIKAKTSRYVMQSMSGKAFGDNNKVMRSIKRLQDALGVLHDNYINEEIAREIVKKQANHSLIYQAGIFVGNERAQALRVRKLLPDLFDKFASDWHKWY